MTLNTAKLLKNVNINKEEITKDIIPNKLL